MPQLSTRKRPNILLVMFDQLSPQSLPFHGQTLVRAPCLQSIAESGVVFDSAYCNSPLCAPSRFSMMAGQLVSRIGAYDNAAEFPASIPTFAHYLRRSGYRTCLSGKMHFVGPDQLHGFEERVTTDMYPGDFGWTPTWDEPSRIHWWYHNMLSVIEAGPYDRSLEMDYDEEVGFQAVRWLYDAARGNDERPFMLTVSFMDPHDPYLAPRADWELYDHAAIDMPAVPSIARDRRDPLSQRLFDVYDRGEYRVTDEHVRAARHAYYAMITYVDREFGKLLAALKATGLADDTVVIATADHGDMLGERGLWYKMNFFERSARVPLIMHWPRNLPARRVSQNVSLVDLLPTLRELAGDDADAVVPIDGCSLIPLASGSGGAWSDTVYGEYMGEGTFQPLLMIRRGNHKYISCHGDPPQLFDLSEDPHEMANLAKHPAHAELAGQFAKEVASKWDSARIRDDVLITQRQRILVQEALLRGKVHPWDYQPQRDASKEYNRNYSSELYDTDRRARIPYRTEPARDT